MSAFSRIALAGLLVLSGPAAAQTLPQTIQLIIPYSPGGSADVLGRLLAKELGTRLGRTIVAENKPGGNGVIGISAVTRAAPDGATFGLSAIGPVVIGPHVPTGATPDVLPNLVPVAKIADIALVLVADPKSGIKTVKDVVDRSKAQDGGLSYGSSGEYGVLHLSVEQLKKATDANLVHVVYKGSVPAVTDVLGGHIPIASVDLTSAIGAIRGGSLVALGLSNPTRSKIAPEIPLVSESVPGFAGANSWYGLFAPKGTPEPLVGEMKKAVQEILARPEIQEQLQNVGLEAGFLEPEAFTALMNEEKTRWQKVLGELAK